jgi:hypothetical protein
VSVEAREVAGPGWAIRVSGDFVPVEDRLVPSFVELVVSDDEQPTITARVEVRDGVPHVAAVRFESEPGQREVRQADLRATQVAALTNLAAGFAYQVTDNPEGGGEVRFGVPDSDFYEESLAAVMAGRKGKGKRSLTPAFLARVAEIYRANLADGPTRAVRATFMVSERTASDYVQRARRAGLLPPTTPGKKQA